MGSRKLTSVIIVSLLIIIIGVVSVFTLNKNNNKRLPEKAYNELCQSFANEAAANIMQIKNIGQQYKGLYQRKELEQKSKGEDMPLLAELEGKEKEIYYKYRLLSCILGAFYGDCIGSYCEFNNANPLNHNTIFSETGYWKNQCDGQEYLPTDDSEKAMALAYAIMSNPDCSNIDHKYILYHYNKWFESFPFDVGVNTTSLKSIIDSYHLDNTKGIEDNKDALENIYNKIKDADMMKSSLANGSLMHLSPLICWAFLKNKDKIKEWTDDQLTAWAVSIDDFADYNTIKNQIKEDTTCTNPNEGSIAFAAILTCIALSAINGNHHHMIFDVLRELIKKEEKAGVDFGNDGTNKNIKLSDFFDECIEGSYKKECPLLQSSFYKNFPTDKNNIGWAGHAIRLIAYILINWDLIKEAAEKEKKSMYRFIMDLICDLGGDTDTNCAIVGTVIGPLIGYNNFEEKGEEGFFNSFLTKLNTATIKNLTQNEEELEIIKAKRMIYSSYIMYDYVNFLIEIYNTGKINEEKSQRDDNYLSYYDNKSNKVKNFINNFKK